jgi:hypothetical protein
MRHLGQGLYEDVDGRRYQWDGPDDLADCSCCEAEPADYEDGLCSFCREDSQIEAARQAREEQARSGSGEERLRAWVQADPARGKPAPDVARQLNELRRLG